MKKQLNMTWKEWRTRHYRSLLAGGVFSHNAAPIAEYDAIYRRRLTKIIGKKAAQEAELVPFRDGWALIGSAAGLSDEQLIAIESIKSRRPPPIQKEQRRGG